MTQTKMFSCLLYHLFFLNILVKQAKQVSEVGLHKDPYFLNNL